MRDNTKLNNPIYLQLGENGNFIVTAGGKFRLTGKTSTMGVHHGFITTVGKIRTEYPTDGKISAVGFEHEMLQVYEEGKEFPWQVDVTGALIESAYNEKVKQKVKRR